MKQSIGLVVLAAVLALGACGGEQDGAGGVSKEESRQLNEAAEMLDASPDSLVASDETGLGNSEATNEAGTNAATGDLPVSDNAAANGQ
jgi:hypothetical protein